MYCFSLLHDRDKSTIILFNVEKGSVGCLNITTRRPHEFFYHTGAKIALWEDSEGRDSREEVKNAVI